MNIKPEDVDRSPAPGIMDVLAERQTPQEAANLADHANTSKAKRRSGREQVRALAGKGGFQSTGQGLG